MRILKLRVIIRQGIEEVFDSGTETSVQQLGWEQGRTREGVLDFKRRTAALFFQGR